MSCGCCLEACPQYNEVTIDRHEGESEEACRERRGELLDRHFIGAAAMSEAVLMNTNEINETDRILFANEKGAAWKAK